MKYKFESQIKRVVTDMVSLDVVAENETEARKVATKVLLSFPQSHGEEGVSYCYIENREYHDTEVLTLDEREEQTVA